MKKTTIILIIISGFSSCETLELRPDKSQNFNNNVNHDISMMSESYLSQNCSFAYGEDDTNNPIGGGSGYNQLVLESQATKPIIRCLSQLVNALDSAVVGDILYISDTANIDIGSLQLKIKGGVTLASGRGNNGSCGGRLKTTIYGNISPCDSNSDWLTRADEFNGRPSIIFDGDNSRITGIRFEGPFGEIGVCSPMKAKFGVSTNGYNRVILDNNEFFYWPYAAVLVTGNSNDNVKIINNRFYHNRQTGFGYGVVIGGQNFALIKGNVFSQNRHDIASSGLQNSGYEASYNAVLGGNTMHNFDIHNNNGYSGSIAYIHHNQFYEARPDYPSIGILGKPNFMCLIEKNKFIQAIDKAIAAAGDKTNIIALNNIYDWDGYSSGNYKGWYVSRRWDKDKPYAYIPTIDFGMMPIAIGNFDESNTSDGQDTTEIFTIDNQGYWLRGNLINPEQLLTLAGRANLNWKFIHGGYLTLSSLAFKDFDGDGRTDIFKSDNGLWYISFSGQSSWCNPGPCPYNNAPGFTIENIAFGNFYNPNDPNKKKYDVFKTNGTDWHISYGALSAWTYVNTSGLTIENLRFGDFNGDGRTDVFKTAYNTWHVSYGASSGWEYLNTSGEALTNLLFEDMNNDGKTDILVKRGNYFQVSWSGSTGWVDLTYNNYPNIFSLW